MYVSSGVTLIVSPELCNLAMYKVSKYNFYLEIEDKCYIYNAISNTYREFPLCVYNNLKKIDSLGRFIALDIEDCCLRELLSLRIIYDADMSEAQYLKHRRDLDVLDTMYSSLIVLPNLNCNLDCHYCYEKCKQGTLSLENEEVLTSFLLNETKRKKFLNIRWSGGEPMLSWAKIRRMSEHILKGCEASGCDYSSSMITNGTLLTKTLIDEFLACSIKAIQITLDGDSELHNKIRYYRSNHKGTFDDILQNVCLASQKIKIHLRINVDKNNITRMPYLFDEIAKAPINKKNVQLFCRPVMCSLARTPSTQIMSPSEFLEAEIILLNLAKERGLQYSFHRGIGGKSFRCCANAIEGFYISPTLQLYKCPMFIDYDDKHTVGYISKEGDVIITNTNEFSIGLKKSPFDAGCKCKDCKVLPLCNGECVMQSYLSPTDPLAGCIPERVSIEEKIKYAITNDIELEAFKRPGFLDN